MDGRIGVTNIKWPENVTIAVATVLFCGTTYWVVSGENIGWTIATVWFLTSLAASAFVDVKNARR